ncbi:hypothetical protein [Halorussus pelagicus]|uniref:hypothetical protein n=1 Tax=Halorussus pelagicus TaxID=2505977 RepID=UPI000FFB1C1E|nr:hypothetical protein [Halorussus pelagicus]
MGTALQVVYVGEETRGDAVAAALPDAEVTSERDGAGALDRLERDEVDCVVVENESVGGNGGELLATVGRRAPAVARVLLAESVRDAPDDAAFVPTRPRSGLPARTARRIERETVARASET